MIPVVAQSFTVPDSIRRGLDGPDTSSALSAWLATVPDGPGPLRDFHGSIVTVAGGEPVRMMNRIVIDAPYHVSATFRLTGRSDLILDFSGGGAFDRLVDQPGNPHLVLDHCSSIHLEQPTVVGLKPGGARYLANREAESGFRFEGSQHVRVVGFRSDGVWGDHIYFGKTNRSPTLSTDVVLTDGACGESGRDPIAATATQSCGVYRSSFGPGRTCIDAEPNGATGGVYGLTVDRCVFRGPYTGLWFAAVGGSSVGIVDGVTLNGNQIVGGSLHASVGGGERRSNFTVTGNTGDKSEGNPQQCIQQFKGCTGALTVTGNRNPVNPGRSMLFARFPGSTGTITYAGNWKDDAPVPDYSTGGV